MLKQVIQVIQKYSEKQDINEDSKLKEIGIDSLQVIEILLDLEDTFNVNIPDNDNTPFFTVKELADYIAKLKEGA